MKSQLLNWRQARWAMFLSEFDFKLQWAPGSQNVADAASRRADYQPKKGDTHLEIQRRTILNSSHTEFLATIYTPLNPITPSPLYLSALTTISIDNSDLLDKFKDGYKNDTQWRTAMVNGDSDFAVEHEIVFHRGRVYVPEPLRTEIVFSHHDKFIGGHPGRRRTESLVTCDYSWPGMSRFIRNYVESCDTCPRIKDA